MKKTIHINESQLRRVISEAIGEEYYGKVKRGAGNPKYGCLFKRIVELYENDGEPYRYLENIIENNKRFSMTKFQAAYFEENVDDPDYKYVYDTPHPERGDEVYGDDGLYVLTQNQRTKTIYIYKKILRSKLAMKIGDTGVNDDTSEAALDVVKKHYPHFL